MGTPEFGTGNRFNYGLGWAKPPSPRDGSLLASKRAFGHRVHRAQNALDRPQYDFVYVFLSPIAGT